MENQFKKFIPSIYLKNGKATRSLTDPTVVFGDPALLARTYADHDADGLLVFDQSLDEAEHRNALDVIGRICRQVGVPVIGAGHIDTPKDIEALLNAGCTMAAVNFSRQDNIELVKPACQRYGKGHIAACYRGVDAIEDNRALIDACVTEMILIDETQIAKALKIEGTPSILSMPDISLDKVLEFFSMGNVSGITGNAVNDNYRNLSDLKRLCRENGASVHYHAARYAWKDFRKDPQGLLPVVVQEDSTGEVLMVAYMNEEAYRMTVRTGRMTYWSRSRNELWIKGDTSGHFQYVKSLTGDCDMDTLLAKVDQIGAACHTGHHSCFFQTDQER